jgi:tRNA nucleotidyltransferase (CCA-adding enzyme)
MGDNAQKVLLDFADVISVAVPEIGLSVGFDQRNKHHIYNVWEHTVHAISNCPKDLICRLVMLLHDSGKPDTFSVDVEGTGHFYGHAKVSAKKAETFFERSGAGNNIKELCCSLINLHDSDLFSGERSIRRWLGKLGLDNLLRLIDIKRADNLAQAPEYMDRLEKLAATRSKVLDVAASQPCVSKSMLAVDGNHIKALGYTGREIGIVLDELLDAVIDGRCENTEDALLKYSSDRGQCR